MKKYGSLIVLISIAAGILLGLFLHKLEKRTFRNETYVAQNIKSIFDIMSEAYDKAVKVNGTLDKWGLVPGDNLTLSKRLKKYALISWESDGICWGLKDYYGMVCIMLDDPECKTNRGKGKLANSCGNIKVNPRTAKWPLNRDGKDMFNFIITKTGLVPSGTEDETGIIPCSHQSISEACTNWAIVNGNLGYLHY